MDKKNTYDKGKGREEKEVQQKDSTVILYH